ncbi:ClpA/ClpB-like protein [Prauserella shujinwangii]|uniref:ClpA/ClpB-like protein n=1 Tax=Prauserella shujinwangii TaxID=1453103 RepID=A0A2T0LQ80_9PSEU|nr:Clp protease N-terminal domain-containing protein [Prauserella shujinwangii]PRX45484.1 ClpA/ClpB-like protein [Prauserella shujinwangii]
MFERFTKDAREVVVEAQGKAVAQDAAEIGAEHLLLALIAAPDGRAARLLTELGAEPELLTAELNNVRRRGGLSDSDAEALAEFGIDVDAIVERVERAHGEYALADRPRRTRSRTLRHRPFTSGAKQVLERTLREALDLGDRHIGSEHILLALATQPGATADVLATYGADPVAIRRALARP